MITKGQPELINSHKTQEYHISLSTDAMSCSETELTHSTKPYFALQEWSQCERLFRMVLHGRLRVPEWIHVAIRPVPCRLRRRGASKASQALCSLVLRVPQGGDPDPRRE